MLHTIKKTTIILSCLLFSQAIFSQETEPLEKEESEIEMVTDRPDQTESPTVVPKGSLQIETGFGLEEYETNSIKTKETTYNTTLLRYGLLDNLELRIGADFVEGKVDGFSNVASGFSPLLLGFKVGITEEDGMLPEIGFLGHISAPLLAATDYRPESTGVDFRFSFAHTLSEKSSLAYNLGGAVGDDSSELAYIYTLVYGYSITDKLGAYLELYGDLPEDSRPAHSWDAGLTYSIKNNIQLDVLVGSGINTDQTIMIGGGLCIRLPK